MHEKHNYKLTLNRVRQNLSNT